MALSKFPLVLGAFVIFQYIYIKKVSSSDIPGVWNIRCNDKDFQRTISWESTESNSNLQLVKFKINFCLLPSCDRWKNVRCYSDDERTKNVTRIKNSSCKSTNLQSEVWSFYSYSVKAYYRNLTTGRRVRTSNSTICGPISQKTTLSPPKISVSSAMTSINVTLKLEENLIKTIKILSDQGSVFMTDFIYHSCSYPKGKSSECGKEKFGLENSFTHSNLEPNKDYEISGWYTISRGLRSDNNRSPNVTTTVKTLPDIFPQWAQIALVCGISGIIASVISLKAGCSILSTRKKKLKDKILSLPTDGWVETLENLNNADFRFLRIELHAVEIPKMALPIKQRSRKGNSKDGKQDFKLGNKVPPFNSKSEVQTKVKDMTWETFNLIDGHYEHKGDFMTKRLLDPDESTSEH